MHGATQASSKVPPHSCSHWHATEPVNSWAAQVPSFGCSPAHATQSANCWPHLPINPTGSLLASRTPWALNLPNRLNINRFHCPVQTPVPYSGVGRPPPPHLAFGRPAGWPQPLQGPLPGPGPPGMMGPLPPHAAPGAHQQQWRPRGQGESACSMLAPTYTRCQRSSLPGLVPAACLLTLLQRFTQRET